MRETVYAIEIFAVANIGWSADILIDGDQVVWTTRIYATRDDALTAAKLWCIEHAPAA